MSRPNFYQRLLLSAIVIAFACIACSGCAGKVLVAYRIVSVEAQPEAVNLVTYKRVYGPGPATVTREIRDSALFSHPERWRVGADKWEWVDRAQLREGQP